MNAAVVRSFELPPRYEQLSAPRPGGESEIVLDVLAAALHPRVRSGAAGRHYTSTDALPLVPGVDAVGRSAEGELLYFVALDGGSGTMAEQAVLDTRRAVRLPADADVVSIAAAMNPGMSSWLALRKRVSLQPGQSVLVLGATGAAGTMAVQIAKLLGAGHVIAAGRDPERLSALMGLGADEAVSLLGESDELAGGLARACAEVDVVVDYLWGTVAELALPALVRGRTEPSKTLTWIEIGSMAGAEITLPSAALRAADLRLLGSGQGSLTTTAIVAELPELAAHINAGDLAIDPLPTPLREVETAWDAPTGPGQRIVFVP